MATAIHVEILTQVAQLLPTLGP